MWCFYVHWDAADEEGDLLGAGGDVLVGVTLEIGEAAGHVRFGVNAHAEFIRDDDEGAGKLPDRVNLRLKGGQTRRDRFIQIQEEIRQPQGHTVNHDHPIGDRQLTHRFFSFKIRPVRAAFGLVLGNAIAKVTAPVAGRGDVNRIRGKGQRQILGVATLAAAGTASN
ncbi:MAG: hypothetical protein RLZZ511_3004 [Cyanobacteriota bacterium]